VVEAGHYLSMYSSVASECLHTQTKHVLIAKHYRVHAHVFVVFDFTE